MISFTIPLAAKGAPNLREHWGAKARRVKTERAVTSAAALVVAKPIREMRKSLEAGGSAIVTLTRVSPRMLDGDNWQAGAKACRDEIAKMLGIDDADPCVGWRYEQRKGKPKERSVEVRIERVVMANIEGEVKRG